MSMEWFRWYHGTVSDPKFGAVARKCKQPKPAIIAVWASLLEYASQADERGNIAAADPETIAACLDMEDADVIAIMDGLTGKGLIDGGHIVAWDKRQVRREREDDSKERVRAYRKRKGESGNATVTPGNATVTPGNANFRQVTPPESESESDADTDTEKNKKSVVCHGGAGGNFDGRTDGQDFFELTPERIAAAKERGFTDSSWVERETAKFIRKNEGQVVNEPDKAWLAWLDKGRKNGIGNPFKGRLPDSDRYANPGRPVL